LFALAAWDDAALAAGDRGGVALFDWRSGAVRARREFPAEVLVLAADPGRRRAVAGLADGSMWMVELARPTAERRP
jgi:hypothetical protein